MRSCLYVSLVAFTSGFVFRLLKVKVVFSRWSCSFFRACCATLAHQAECSRLLRAHLWNLPCRGEAQHFARGHLLRVHLQQVHALAVKRRSCGTTFFLSRVFPELTPHRFRTHFVQNLSRRHTLTAFSKRNFLFNATLCAIRTVSKDPQQWPRFACSPADNQPSIHVS